MTSLTYFFSPIYSLKYITTDTNKIYLDGLTGDFIRLDIPYNDSNKNVMIMNIAGDDKPKQYFFTLNLIYLTKSINIPNSSYSIMLQGNRNDYNNDNLNQLLIMIPIMDTINNTISNTSTDPIIKSSAVQYKIKTANQDLSNIINNISDKVLYNPSKPIDPNNFLFNINSGTLYIPKTSPNNITRQIIVLNSSELYKNIINPGNEGDINLNAINNAITLSPDDYDIKIIEITNNEQDVTLTTITEPIYIDCNPVNDNSEPIDTYTSVNPIQLNFSKINNFVIWFLSFLTLFIVLLIVYLIYTLFSMPSSKSNNSTSTATATSTATTTATTTASST